VDELKNRQPFLNLSSTPVEEPAFDLITLLSEIMFLVVGTKDKYVVLLEHSALYYALPSRIRF